MSAPAAAAQAAPKPAPSNTAQNRAVQAQYKKAKGAVITSTLVGSLAAVILVWIAAVLLWPRHKSAEPLPASAFGGASPVATAGKPDALGPVLDGVVAAAQKVGRPQNEVTALADAKTKILALVAQKAAPNQRDETAREMAKAEITALGRSERRTWRDLGAPPDPNAVPDPANTVTALNNAKIELDAKLATDLTGLDAAAAAGTAQQVLEAYATFQTATAAAAPQYVAARKKDLAGLVTAAQSTADQVTALADISKPWFLASQSRKQAYQLRQDNAAQAKALFTQLSSAASAAQSSKDMKLVVSTIAQLSAGQATLSSLYAASNAAKP
jgi:hypothetical protein